MSNDPRNRWSESIEDLRWAEIKDGARDDDEDPPAWYVTQRAARLATLESRRKRDGATDDKS